MPSSFCLKFYHEVMTVISAGDFRKGSKFIYNDAPHVVVDHQHVKPGKGGAFMRTKMKNLLTGSIYEETFRTEEKFSEPDLQYRDVQYLYSDSEGHHFMDQESFEQVALSDKLLGDIKNFLKSEIVYTVLNYEGRAIEVSAPLFLELAVIETVPGVRGDTAQGRATKPAKVETGLELQVPLFVDEGDIIKVDTRDSKYIERVNKK
jgi:elongation factor P